MASKLAAAQIASWSGVRSVIARASVENVLIDAVDGASVGTTFDAHDRRLNARKLWIAFAAEVKGTIGVDEGARRALVERQTSLLPAGVTGVTGNFGEGDMAEICGPDGVAFARGLVFMTAAELSEVTGRHTSLLPDGMVHEVVHRDDLVLLPA